ncbi:MAG: dimethyl sulfoxide reductase anchor subunit [Lysobacter sp.]|nr:dimethyl sulfoxide reductase anchor subunit [Lysobacter sp.]
MRPTLSIVLFTTLSGAGFGLWFWIALRIALGDRAEWFDGLGWALGLIAGAALVAIGTLASLWHLGKPARVWRAFSQWRTSWMSREGVFALAAFAVAACALAVQSVWIELPQEALVLRFVAATLALLCVAAVYSTAMIYASLVPIPAWRHRLVVPAYLSFAALGGGILFGPFAGTTLDVPALANAGVIGGAFALWAIKRRYWRDIDRTPLPHDTGDAVGLPGRRVSTFERPHTEANFVTREMVFVFARKHAKRLRLVASVLFTAVPAMCAVLAWWLPQSDGALLWVAAVAFQLGAMIERWLFFAEARHVVALYY